MDPFVGEIRMFAGNYPPENWAFCDGQELSVSGYQALFSLLGTTYGGDGVTTFKLPDFRGRIPVHAGQGPGLSSYPQGMMVGVESVSLTVDQIPSHNHPLQASQDAGSLSSPSAAILAKPSEGQGFAQIYPPDPTKIVDLAAEAVSKVGGNIAHNNIMPTLCISFIISLQGIYPSRN